ncbi:MAG: hypothetical protein F7C35_06145 [Desulfurococcales archaeon]|nr:hypothetical protein [Desulfurococcales archaeon]
MTLSNACTVLVVGSKEYRPVTEVFTLACVPLRELSTSSKLILPVDEHEEAVAVKLDCNSSSVEFSGNGIVTVKLPLYPSGENTVCPVIFVFSGPSGDAKTAGAKATAKIRNATSIILPFTYTIPGAPRPLGQAGGF